ncbi:hypothetical protein IFM89_028624, partial [Coptis chinensis]
MLKCCKGKQRGDKFSKSHKMGASNAPMGKSYDIESYGNSQNVTQKVGRCKGKNTSGRSIPAITMELKVSFYHVGTDLFLSSSDIRDSVSKLLWHHRDDILLFLEG